MEILCVTASHQDWAHVLIVPFIVSCMFYPLGHSTVKSTDVYKHIILDETMLTIKKING